MPIIDSHAHIDHLEDISSSLKSAHEAGVSDIVCMSMDLASCRRNLELQKEFSAPHLHIALGMHPSETDLEQLEPICALIEECKEDIVAVGEIGLDFWYKWVKKDDIKKDEQRQAYRRFLELAKQCDLPAVIHSRGAWQECLDTAKEVGVTKAEFHWYSGPIDVLKDILDAGYFVSTSPSVGYSKPSREAMTFAPIEQTMIETDCPVYYKLPENPDMGYKSEPRDVFKTLKAYAQLKDIDEQTALEKLNDNAKTFFNL